MYTKLDLLKLKDSKPVPIIAHSHETIVPVVYASMVNKFLKKQGVELPLTHHKLAELKREAKAVGGTLKDHGYAKGTSNLKSKTKKISQKSKVKVNQNQNVVININKKSSQRHSTSVPNLRPSFFDQLRPNNWASIRPLSAGYVQPASIPNYKQEADEHLKRELSAIEKYRKELQGHSIIPTLAKRVIDQIKDKEPLVKSIEPIRKNDFDDIKHVEHEIPRSDWFKEYEHKDESIWDAIKKRLGFDPEHKKIVKHYEPRVYDDEAVLSPKEMKELKRRENIGKGMKKKKDDESKDEAEDEGPI